MEMVYDFVTLSQLVDIKRVKRNDVIVTLMDKALCYFDAS